MVGGYIFKERQRSRCQWSDNTFMSDPSNRVRISATPTARNIKIALFLSVSSFITIEAEDAAYFIGHTILYVIKYIVKIFIYLLLKNTERKIS